MFQRDFKNNVKDELMRYEKEINTLEDLIEAAIELDDKLYQRAMKRRHTERQLGRAKNYVSNCVFEASRKQRHDETMFMKLNAMLSKKSKSNGKRSSDKKKGYSVLRVWQRGPLCAKLQIEERDSTTTQHDTEKRTQSRNKRELKKNRL